jgi:peptide/nickel transport system permease protein
VTAVAAPYADRQLIGRPSGPISGLVRGALRLRQSKVGLLLTSLVVLTAVVGPYVAPKSPSEFYARAGAAPQAGLPFGADNLGRDVLSRFLHGGRALLLLAAVATILGIAIGTLIGMQAGYSRGWVDEVLMRGNDVVLALPQLVFALLCMTLLGPKKWLLVAAIGVTHAPRVARVVRAATLEVAQRDFVKAVEVLGVRKRRILISEILPNITGPLMVELGLRFTYSIGLVASLSFLGLGIQPPTADWGLMINENRPFLALQPWAVALPIIAIGVITVGTNLIADGFAQASAGVNRETS